MILRKNRYHETCSVTGICGTITMHILVNDVWENRIARIARHLLTHLYLRQRSDKKQLEENTMYLYKTRTWNIYSKELK